MTWYLLSEQKIRMLTLKQSFLTIINTFHVCSFAANFEITFEVVVVRVCRIVNIGHKN